MPIFGYKAFNNVRMPTNNAHPGDGEEAYRSTRAAMAEVVRGNGKVDAADLDRVAQFTGCTRQELLERMRQGIY